MATKSCIERRISKNGIEVVVTIEETTFDVSITIYPDAEIFQKYQCEEFWLKVLLCRKVKKLKEPIRIEGKKIKYDKSSAYNNARLTFKTAECKCEISLSPKFYAREEALVEAKKRQEAKINNLKKISFCKFVGARMQIFNLNFHTKRT